MVETSMRHQWWNTQTSTSGGSYRRICLITWRGSAPAAIAEVVGLREMPSNLRTSPGARQIPCEISLPR
ncbi:hypothetical protein PS684_04573 [Pseudomonas fluorescens]|nr:hypothetical protein PS681_04620 [Pseudomonas fluorescens]VVN62340.1 hypothetical protein PS684_04573 [Pseudomonas fluorescens]